MVFGWILENAENMVVDWYKDDQPREKVKSVIKISLNTDLPESYDKESFNSKIDLLMNHFVDMAVQGYGWIAA
jgi:type I restriction enzyme R subunit